MTELAARRLGPGSTQEGALGLNYPPIDDGSEVLFFGQGATEGVRPVPTPLYAMAGRQALVSKAASRCRRAESQSRCRVKFPDA
jgi:hypothetical protein